MTNYTHLRSQMIRLLELLRSILYPDVFDELEEEHKIGRASCRERV